MVSVASLFSWFALGFAFSLTLFLPILAFRIVKNLLAMAADDIRGS